MSIKMPDLNREEVEKLVAEYDMHPAIRRAKFIHRQRPQS